MLKELRAKISPTTTSEIEKRLKKAERALELAVLNEPQSIIDKNLAEAAATLIKSLENQNEAVVSLGSLLVIKFNGNVYIKNLSPMQAKFLEDAPEIIIEPKKLLERLSKIKELSPP